MSSEGANSDDTLERLAEKGIDGGFGGGLQPLHLTRRSEVEALDEKEEEEENGENEENERRCNGDGDAGGKDQQKRPQHFDQFFRNLVVRRLDFFGESIL